MNEKQTELIYRAMEIIGKRAVDPRRTRAQRMSYSSALDMLAYALEESYECLAQYDDVELDCAGCEHYYAHKDNDCAMCNVCENYQLYAPIGED